MNPTQSIQKLHLMNECISSFIVPYTHRDQVVGLMLDQPEGNNFTVLAWSASGTAIQQCLAMGQSEVGIEFFSAVFVDTQDGMANDLNVKIQVVSFKG